MPDSVFQRLSQLLQQQNITFAISRHEAVYTSEEAAKIRGASLASGAKALICKADGQFIMFVLPADLRLDSKAVRKQHKFRSLRFASREEVFEITGLEPGSIPPFGGLFDLPTWCDEQMAEQEQINFNAGDHVISINMTYADYAAVEQPQIGCYAQTRQ